MSNNTPSSVICFKNGYSYVNVPICLSPNPELTKDGDIKECQVGPLPDFAVHGTVSLTAQNPEKVKIFSLSRTEKKVIIDPVPLKVNDLGENYSYEAILAENIGTRVELTCLLGDSVKGVSGIIKSVHKEQSNNSFVVLQSSKTNGIERLIRCASIVSLETTHRKSNLDEKEDDDNDRDNCLSVRYTTCLGSSDTVEAELSYLTRGLTWAPSYVLRQCKSSKILSLEGNACLLCDLPFFTGKIIESMSLVTGQPKMECKNLNDPLASGNTAAQFIRQLEIDPIGGKRSDGFKNPRRYGGCEDDDSDEGTSTGDRMGDFYFYRLKNVPLHYNQPMSLPFIEEFTSEPYQDVYFFDLSNKGSANDDTMVEATHAITFKNTSGQPFTTGPVSVLMAKESKVMDKDDKIRNNDENNFLVQSLMKFTGPNKIATVEITKALDVEGKFVLTTSKERKVESKNKNKGELVCIEKTGSFTITNLKNEEVECKIDYLLHGQLQKSNPPHIEATEVNDGGIDQNPITKYVWQVKVPPKDKAELIFIFTIKEWDVPTLFPKKYKK